MHILRSTLNDRYLLNERVLDYFEYQRKLLEEFPKMEEMEWIEEEKELNL